MNRGRWDSLFFGVNTMQLRYDCFLDAVKAASV